jgi:hypothetical protein
MDIIRFTERLGITEEQKSEITNNIGCFLKYLSGHFDLKDLDAEKIASWWLKYAAKPGWIGNKLQEDVEFIAQICSFIEAHKAYAVNYEEMEESRLKLKSEDRRQLELFLFSIMQEKTEEQPDWGKVEKMSDKELKDEINSYFYINNQYDTLGENPLMAM